MCVRFAAVGPGGAEGDPVGTSTGPEGEGRKDGAPCVPAAEGFGNNPGQASYLDFLTRAEGTPAPRADGIRTEKA